MKCCHMYQYIKILTCVCLCVCVCVCVTEVGCLWGGTFVLQFTEPQTLQRMFKNIGHGLEQLGLQADAIREQQSKQTQSGSSS